MLSILDPYLCEKFVNFHKNVYFYKFVCQTKKPLDDSCCTRYHLHKSQLCWILKAIFLIFISKLLDFEVNLNLQYQIHRAALTDSSDSSTGAG